MSSAPLFCGMWLLALMCACGQLRAEPLADAPAGNDAFRGLWVVRTELASEELIGQTVATAVNDGYTDLFVQVRGRGDAYYRSYFVPGPEGVSPDIPDAFDPLDVMIRQAHAAGLRVHAWFNVYLTWSGDNPPREPSHPLNSHPEWFMVSLDGLRMADCPIDSVRSTLIEGRYLSPGLEEVRSYLTQVITEVLVNYDVDGVHLDYVRFPGRRYDFTEDMRLGFVSRTGVDPVSVVKNSEAADPTLHLLADWAAYRAEMISLLVEQISLRVRMTGKDIPLSAAVKPEAATAYYEYGQDWVGWLRAGLVDFVVPMCYMTDTDLIEDVLSNSLAGLDRTRIVGGIGAYRITAEITADQIALMRRLGLKGYCLFSSTVFREQPGYAERVRQAVVSGATDTAPTAPPVGNP